MQEYIDNIKDILLNGEYKENRTDAGTIWKPNIQQTFPVTLDQEAVQKGSQTGNVYNLPVLTTKRVYLKGALEEFFTFLSGTTKYDMSFWEPFTNDEEVPPSPYGFFWRKYPIPKNGNALPGMWKDVDDEYVTETEIDGETFYLLDQVRRNIKRLKNNPQSRRHILTAWHPGNAMDSDLPPCHWAANFSVMDGGEEVNIHVKQRSGDMPVGVPFNMVHYSVLLSIVAQKAGLRPRKMYHTIDDAHIYTGKNERRDYYRQNFDSLQKFMRRADDSTVESVSWEDVREWLIDDIPKTSEANKDHIPNILKQVQREPRETPVAFIPDKDIDNMSQEDVEFEEYNSHSRLDYGLIE